MKRWITAAAIIVALAFSDTPTILAKTAAPLPPETGVNKGVVELMTARTAGISVRIAEDLANVIDDGTTRRVLPVVGKGALQNLTDLKLLRGIDMAILQVDVLDYARQQNLLPGIEYWTTYITKLYNEEFHLLARQDIKSVSDLANQQVNVDLLGAEGSQARSGRGRAAIHCRTIARKRSVSNDRPRHHDHIRFAADRDCDSPWAASYSPA